MTDKLYYICLFLVLIIFLALILSDNNFLFQVLINLILSGSFLYIIYDYIISKKNIDQKNKQAHYEMYNVNLNNRKYSDSKRNRYALGNLGNLNQLSNLSNLNNAKQLNNLSKNKKQIHKKNDQEINSLLNEINNEKETENELDFENEKNQIINNNTPMYENLENLKRLNYYSSQGLDCAYDLQFNKDFSNFKDIYNLTGCNGDTKLANRMKFMSLKDKFAKENRAAFDRTTIQHLFTDELNIEEKRIWWENPDVYDSVM